MSNEMWSCERILCVAPQNKGLVGRVLEGVSGKDIPKEDSLLRSVGRPCAGCLEIQKLDTSLNEEIIKRFQR